MDPGNEAVSDHDWSEAVAFQEKWVKNWNPSLGQQQEGWVKGCLIASILFGILNMGFFKRMLGYEYCLFVTEGHNSASRRAPH